MDLKDLDIYIIVEISGEKLAGHKAETLRIMDGEIEPGVKALWDDDKSTLVAFLFAQGHFTEEKARAWVQEKEAAGINLVQVGPSPTYLRKLVDLLKDHVHPSVFAAASTLARAVSPKSFPEEAISTVTIDGRWFVQGAKNFPLAPEERAWEWNAAKAKAILDAGGWPMFANAHLVVDLSLAEEGQRWPEVQKAYKLPIAELIDSKLNYVWKGAVAANGALHGARTAMKVPQTVKVAASKTVAAIYRKFDKDDENVVLESFDDIRKRVDATIANLYSYRDAEENPHWAYLVDIGPEQAVFEMDGLMWAVPYTVQEDGKILLGEPVAAERAWKARETDQVIPLTVYAFPMGPLSAEASSDVIGDDTGLLWKEIAKVSQWFKLDSGRRIEITKQFIQDVLEAFQAKVLPYVSVPADGHHFETGGVVPAEDNTGFVEKLKVVGQSLWAGLRLTDPETRKKVAEGTVKDVSIFAAPNVHDPRTGNKWNWVLMHVLLTNYPQVQGLSPFGTEEPVAASVPGVKIIRLQEVTMDNVTLSAEEAKRWEALKALNLTGIDPKVLQGLDLQDAMKAVAERQATREKARGLEVQALLLALQGQGEHPGVVQVKDTRHWPVVCTAVEKALKEQPQVMALSIHDDGKTDLDTLVLSIVNAIPVEGRMSLTVQPGGDRSSHEQVKPTDEQIDKLDNRLK